MSVVERKSVKPGSRCILPRLIRFRDAPDYLGMDRNRFNSWARPCLTELRIGKQGIAFDRLELDAWADSALEQRGRRPVSGAT
jgi:predicted DNA-binding transcriptional regulator AlpA